MSIDHDAGRRARKAEIVKSAIQGEVLAHLSIGPSYFLGYRIGIRTIRSMIKKGWIEMKPIHARTDRKAYHITDAGRAVAVASPTVQAHLDQYP